jgi:hypothetical protein
MDLVVVEDFARPWLTMYMYLLCTCTYYVHVLTMYIYLLCTCIYYVHVLTMYMYLLCTCIYYVHVLLNNAAKYNIGYTKWRNFVAVVSLITKLYFFGHQGDVSFRMRGSTPP